LGVFSRFIRFEMEDGSKIRFWYDLWCGGQPLKEAFLGLFSIACCKKVLMTKDVQFINDTLSGISFSRSIHDWEVGWSLCSLTSCTLLGWDEMPRIKSIGLLPKGGRSTSNPFPGRAFGEKAPSRVGFLFIYLFFILRARVDGSVREDFKFGQPEKETYHIDGLVLRVQEERGDHKSSSSPL
jgi:hypothetical protein